MSWTVKTSPPDFAAFDRLVEAEDGQHFRVRLRQRLAGQDGILTRAWACQPDGSGYYDENAPLAESAHSLASLPPDMAAWQNDVTLQTAQAAHKTYLLRVALGQITIEIP